MYEAIVIGGSAGSFNVIIKMLNELPASFRLPLFLCLHRLKNVRSGFVEALSIKSKIMVIEPDHNEKIRSGIAYLAPSNYHMLIGSKELILLNIEDPINHSRPSIDILFESAAEVYKDKLIGIILSGANNDGAYGLKKIHLSGGLTIVQDPKDAQINTMPDAAIQNTTINHIYDTEQIIHFLTQLNTV